MDLKKINSQLESVDRTTFFSAAFFQSLSSEIRELSLENPAAAYQSYIALRAMLDRYQDASSDSGYQEWVRFTTFLRFNVFPFLSPGNAKDLISQSLLYGIEHENELRLPLEDLIVDMFNLVYSDGDQDYVNSLFDGMIENGEELGVDEFSIGESTFRPTIGSWLRLYNFALGTGPHLGPEVEEFISSSAAVRSLDSERRNILRRILKLYELVKMVKFYVENASDIFSFTVSTQIEQSAPSSSGVSKSPDVLNRKIAAGRASSSGQLPVSNELSESTLNDSVERNKAGASPSETVLTSPSVSISPGGLDTLDAFDEDDAPLPPPPLPQQNVGTPTGLVDGRGLADLSGKSKLPFDAAGVQSGGDEGVPSSSDVSSGDSGVKLGPISSGAVKPTTPAPPISESRPEVVDLRDSAVNSTGKKDAQASQNPSVVPPGSSPKTPDTVNEPQKEAPKKSAPPESNVQEEVMKMAGAAKAPDEKASKSKRSEKSAKVIAKLKSDSDVGGVLGGLATAQLSAAEGVIAGFVAGNVGREMAIGGLTQASVGLSQDVASKVLESAEMVMAENGPKITTTNGAKPKPPQGMKKSSSAVETKSAGNKQSVSEEPSTQSLEVKSLSELSTLQIEDFRKFGKLEHGASVVHERAQGLVRDSKEISTLDVVDAWQKSEPHKIYIEMGRQSMMDRKTVSQLAQERKAEGKPYLTEEEFVAVADLSKNLQEI